VRSDWRVRIDGTRCVLSRSVFAIVRPFLPLLAITILWYPVVGFLLPFVWKDPSMTALGIIFCAPILGMALWVPRLAAHRRRVVLVVEGDELVLGRMRIARKQLLEVVLLPDKRMLGTWYCVFITFAVHDFANLVQLASEREVEAARGIANELAAWLELPINAPATPPPTATIHTRI
jgi:hypothetical protein